MKLHKKPYSERTTGVTTFAFLRFCKNYCQQKNKNKKKCRQKKERKKFALKLHEEMIESYDRPVNASHHRKKMRSDDKLLLASIPVLHKQQRLHNTDPSVHEYFIGIPHSLFDVLNLLKLITTRAGQAESGRAALRKEIIILLWTYK